MRAKALSFSEVSKLQGAILPHLERVCAKDFCDWTPEKVIHEALNDQILLWVVFDGRGIWAVCGTQVRLEDTPSTMKILFLGGTGWVCWANHWGTLLKHARDRGCARVEIEGRKGWRRLIPDLEIIGEKDGLLLYERRLD